MRGNGEGESLPAAKKACSRTLGERKSEECLQVEGQCGFGFGKGRRARLREEC